MSQPEDFTGVWIPAHVFLDDRIGARAKMLYATIASFRECYASNAWFAERLGVSERVVQRYLKALRESGYVEQIAFDGRRRVLVALYDAPDATKTSPLPRQKRRVGGDKNDAHYRYKAKNKEKSRSLRSRDARAFEPPTRDEVEAYAIEACLTTEYVDAFFDHYQSVGWTIGARSKPMRDFKAAYRNWIRREPTLTPKQKRSNGKREEIDARWEALARNNFSEDDR